MNEWIHKWFDGYIRIHQYSPSGPGIIRISGRVNAWLWNSIWWKDEWMALTIHQDVLGVVVRIVVGPEGQTVDGFGSRNIPEHRNNIEIKKSANPRFSKTANSEAL